jgi:pyruvate/2-oxoglutarate dehydrogenase complex dihydrolipoamide dehydrogenase (E3) component
MNPDAIILATGVKVSIPEIPGIHGKNVVVGLDVLAGRADVGQRVAIIGGELVGCEIADYLTEKGKQVTVMRRGETFAADMNPLAREILLARLAQKGIALHSQVQYEEITDQGVVITREGKKQTIEADTVVIAAGARSEVSLLSVLKAKGLKVHAVGDCSSPGKIADALRDGARIAREI